MEIVDKYILSMIITAPFLGATLVIFTPSYYSNIIKLITATTAFTTLILSIYVCVYYDSTVGGFQFISEYNWLENIGISLSLGVDGIAVLMLLLTGIIITTAVGLSWKINKDTKDYFILLLLLVAGVYGVFVSIDLFFLFFFYELAVLPMYLLIGIWGSNTTFKTFIRTKEYGAMKLVLYLVGGSILVWIGIMSIYTYSEMGTFNIMTLQDAEFSHGFQQVVFPLIVIGFGVLAGLWPFHTWSPDGHVAAPTAVSMLHAGVLMKLGSFGIIRVGMTLLPEGAIDWMPVLLILATINVLYGACSAMAQRDLKYVIGYSSVSHMGYVLMGLATLKPLGISGAVLQMFSHGIMTALFFGVVGIIYERTHTRDITILEGLSKRMGLAASFFTVAGLASLGLPGLSSFIAELLIFIGAFQTNLIIGILGIIGAAITAAYILRLIGKVFFGPINKQWDDIKDANRLEGLTTGVLVSFLLIIGLVPFPFLKLIDSTIKALLKGMAI